MNFIKISNEAEFVNRLFLEKLGLSTKRDDANTIGQFGSGSKFAPIAALRKGIRWITVGEDEKGPYQLEFVVKEEDGINSIFCLYDETELKATSFTLEAGMMSWDDSDFQIFREAFANALDEHTARNAKYTIEIVDQVKFEPGLFSVYISATHGLTEIVDNFDTYFSMDRPVVKDLGRYGKMINAKSEKLNVYCKDVQVFDGHQKEGVYPPIFNYEFNNITLNEERRVRYESDIDQMIVYCLGRLDRHDDDDIAIARKLIESDKWKKYETRCIRANNASKYDFDENSAFVPAFVERFGENVGIYHAKCAEYKDAIMVNGLKAVRIESELLYDILKHCGIPNAEDLNLKTPQYDCIQLPERQQEMYDRAYALVYAVEPRVADMKIQFFIPRGDQDTALGVAHIEDKEVYISIKAFDTIRRLIGTLVHEIDHIVEEWGEHDATFRSYADVRIADLILSSNGGNDQEGI